MIVSTTALPQMRVSDLRVVQGGIFSHLKILSTCYCSKIKRENSEDLHMERKYPLKLLKADTIIWYNHLLINQQVMTLDKHFKWVQPRLSLQIIQS